MDDMTTKDLQHYIGQEVLYTLGSLDILVKVLDVRMSYGQRTFLIAPVAGSRCAWVRSGLQFPTEGR